LTKRRREVGIIADQEVQDGAPELFATDGIRTVAPSSPRSLPWLEADARKEQTTCFMSGARPVAIAHLAFVLRSVKIDNLVQIDVRNTTIDAVPFERWRRDVHDTS
jgi:hypothetical protein